MMCYLRGHCDGCNVATDTTEGSTCSPRPPINPQHAISVGGPCAIYGSHFRRNAIEFLPWRATFVAVARTVAPQRTRLRALPKALDLLNKSPARN